MIVFYVIAFVVTYLAHKLPDYTFGSFSLNLLLCSCGPLLGGLVGYQLLKTKNVIGISLLGTRPVFSCIVCVIPVVMLCVTQSKHDLSLILLFAAANFAYCFGEEFGWRHYLQNATNFMTEWRQSFLIGTLWFFWHFSFLEDVSSRMGMELPKLVFPPVMITLLSLLSYLFGLMVKRSKSILFPTVGHLLFKTGLTTMIVTGCVMCVILVMWDRLPFAKKEEAV